MRESRGPGSRGPSRSHATGQVLDPSFRGCNPIPAKIEIRWSSLGVVPLLLYNSISGGRGIAMSQGVRVIGPDRAQLRWEMVDLDSQFPDDHRARLVWAFVEGLDLSEFYDRIKARDAVAGRPATDPQVVLAVWLYATLEGIGSARAIDRLCQQHAAYRWLCGGAPINHDLLAGFRRENAALLDRLLTQSVTGLIAEKLVTLEELAIDGTKVRACAGRGSMSKGKRLASIEKAVAERVGTEERAGQRSWGARAPAQEAGPASDGGAGPAGRAGAAEAGGFGAGAGGAGPDARQGGSREGRTQSLGQRPRGALDATGRRRGRAGVERTGGDRQWLCRGDRSDGSAPGQRIGAGTGRDDCRALWPGAATTARRHHSDDPTGHRQTGRAPSRYDGL